MARSSPEKLAAALRANLKRRKGREAMPSPPPQGAKKDLAAPPAASRPAPKRAEKEA